ncbi:MAG: IS21 family transposase [Eubacterium sp.]
MNQALITQLKILRLSNIKPNFSELARLYDMDCRTVKKYYDGYKGKPTHHNKPSRLDKHKDIIVQKLAIKGANVRAVYEYIISEVDSEIGTYSNFNKYIKTRNLKPIKTTKGHPRYETAPGIQAQVDWKEDVSIANKHGEIFTFLVFDYKLGHSRYCHFTYQLYKTRQDVFDCLIASFKATGGVPRELLFDNMASVVDLKDNRRHVNEKMKAFANDFGFKIKRYKPRHAFTKGKVEVINKFISWMKPYEGEFETEEDLMDILKKVNDKVNTYICQETGVPPLLLFQKEKEYLQPLPNLKIIESYMSHNRQTTVRKDSMISYMNNRYSVPFEYIGKPVNLRVKSDILEIYYKTELVARHELSTKKLNYNKEHYSQLLSHYIKDNDIVAQMAEANLAQMDDFL